MKTEEKIIEEFAIAITDYGFNDEYGYYNDWKEDVKPIIKKYIALLKPLF